MNYREALAYIHSVSWKGSVPGLSRIEELCGRMGHPEKGQKFIHIAGTNGKGSTAAYLTSILIEAGLRVGTFTSPYVRAFNERIAIDGKPISNYMLAKVTEYVKGFADEMTDKPTEFELITAIGFEVFRRKRCDVVVLEVGLGGKLDSTNIIEAPVLSVITGISLDHVNILGDTVEKIAAEKAGIIKEGRPVCMAELVPEAKEVMLCRAAECHSEISVVDGGKISLVSHKLGETVLNYKDRKNLSTTLSGLYQLKNVALVCEAVDTLRKEGMDIPEKALERGIANAKWQARFEVLRKDPTVIFDGGHNKEGVLAAVETYRSLFDKKAVILTGVLKDKDYTEMTKIISGIADTVYTTAPDNPRALASSELAKLYESAGVSAFSAESIGKALSAAVRKAEESDLPLVIIGSLYMYKDIIGQDCIKKNFKV